MPRHTKWLRHLLPALGLLAITSCDAGRPPSSNVMCFTCTQEACQPAADSVCAEGSNEHADTAAGSQFTSGEIDLTGDGIPETVLREGTQVRIEQDGIEVWVTPTNWEVVDVALGDPNDDGRGEVMLAFWRADGEGISRSHPFIIGYRDGLYRTLWGGSAVVDPIHEIELGDLDGDGIQELMVLESSGEDAQAVTMWRWHGWGFSLEWRSEPGTYSDLAFISGNEGLPGSVSVTRVP